MSDSDSSKLPTFTVSSTTVTEGADRYAVFHINLSAASTLNTLLGLTLRDVTARAGGVDYGSANLDESTQVSLDGVTWVSANAVDIPAGATVAKVRTLITDDTATEAGETFELLADLISGRAENLQAVGTCTILDNDAVLAPTLSVGHITVTEGADRFAMFAVALDKPSTTATPLDLKLLGGSATFGADFSASMQWSTDGHSWTTLTSYRKPTIPAGTTRLFVRTGVIDDAAIEGTETFQLTASTTSTSLANTTATGTATIIDNDCAQVRIAAPVVWEAADRFAVFSVMLTKPIRTEAVRFDFRFEDGSAKAGLDFAPAGSPFGPMQVSTDQGRTWVSATCATFAPGQTRVLVRTPIVNDRVNEGNEDFRLVANWQANPHIEGTEAKGRAHIFDGAPPPPPCDPLVLDLDGNGIHTLARDAGAQFDHDGDGQRAATGWVGRGDGLLAIDLDGDGRITSGRELLGDRTILANGQEASDGFAALATLDGNADGRIDGQDAGFAQLRVWEDANANGLTDDGELLSLAERDIVSLSLEHAAANLRQNGNVATLLSSYERGDGSTHQLSEYWFESVEGKAPALDLRDLIADTAAPPSGAAAAPGAQDAALAPALPGASGLNAHGGVAAVHGHQYLELAVLDPLRQLVEVRETLGAAC